MSEEHPYYDSKKRKDWEKFYLKALFVMVMAVGVMAIIGFVVKHADQIDKFFENLIP